MFHSASNSRGSSVSPLIRRNGNGNELNCVVGIHYANLREHRYANLANPFDNILEDLGLKLNP